VQSDVSYFLSNGVTNNLRVFTAIALQWVRFQIGQLIYANSLNSFFCLSEIEVLGTHWTIQTAIVRNQLLINNTKNDMQIRSISIKKTCIILVILRKNVGKEEGLIHGFLT
jgi:hypothetical protein